jgi:hypothetical protein
VSASAVAAETASSVIGLLSDTIPQCRDAPRGPLAAAG